ncbi:MAG: hypothetical protein ABR973_03045 [Candidatus Acidiferrales bacterium]
MSRHRILVLMTTVVVAACVSFAARGAASSNEGKETDLYSPSRLADGTPDFRGIWQARTTAYVNIEGHPAEKGLAAAKSIIVDPPEGKIPYLADALKQRAGNYENRTSADPASNCFQAGVPRATYLPTPFQIVQSVGNLAIVYTDNHAYRIVLPSGIPHDDGIDFFMGDSRGHWEGNTLVIDVTDLGDQTWLDAAGNYHSDQLHVVERYTLLGPDTMKYEATMEDPMVYAKPWSVRLLLYRDKRPGARIIEDECLEGADGLWHHISPFDAKAVIHHDYKAELEAAQKNP